MEHMQSVLELNSVSVVYKSRAHKKSAVNDLDLQINKGEVFGFLGPNGAGKTTTIKAILGFLYPQKGQITIFGRPSGDYTLRKQLGYMPEIANYYWYLSPRELLTMYAGFFGTGKRQAQKKIDQLLTLIGLEAEAGLRMKNFSKGMMQKVSFAQALVNDPDLLILDEPTSGLDPMARMKIRDIIKDLKEAGKTIFFSSHELSEVELISDRVGILHNGSLIKTEKMENILKQKGPGTSLERYFLDIITQGKA